VEIKQTNENVMLSVSKKPMENPKECACARECVCECAWSANKVWRREGKWAAPVKKYKQLNKYILYTNVGAYFQ